MFYFFPPGASKQLGTIIEGESLLNDGAAIVLFNVLLYELIPGQSQTGTLNFHWDTGYTSCFRLQSATIQGCELTLSPSPLKFQHSRYLSTSSVLHLVAQLLDT